MPTFVLALTNRRELIDDAILRPGRLEVRARGRARVSVRVRDSRCDPDPDPDPNPNPDPNPDPYPNKVAPDATAISARTAKFWVVFMLRLEGDKAQTLTPTLTLTLTLTLTRRLPSRCSSCAT